MIGLNFIIFVWLWKKRSKFSFAKNMKIFTKLLHTGIFGSGLKLLEFPFIECVRRVGNHLSDKNFVFGIETSGDNVEQLFCFGLELVRRALVRRSARRREASLSERSGSHVTIQKMTFGPTSCAAQVAQHFLIATI